MVSGTAFAVPTMNEAANLLRTGQADRAAEAYEAILAEDPENDIAWFQLAMAYHTAGRLEDAVAADTKAATFPRVRFSALYNLACAQSLLGDKDAAAATLQTALDAGFLDYDLVKTDPDLEGVRDKLKRELPHARTYTPFRGANGVKLAYSVLLPQGYDPAKTYPALFAFPPGSGGPATADWAVANLWGESNTQGWIVVVPVAPEDGWISHPAHHALEDLLDQILETHRIQDKQFHLAGFSEGAGPPVPTRECPGSTSRPSCWRPLPTGLAGMTMSWRRSRYRCTSGWGARMKAPCWTRSGPRPT